MPENVFVPAITLYALKRWVQKLFAFRCEALTYLCSASEKASFFFGKTNLRNLKDTLKFSSTEGNIAGKRVVIP